MFVIKNYLSLVNFKLKLRKYSEKWNIYCVYFKGVQGIASNTVSSVKDIIQSSAAEIKPKCNYLIKDVVRST
jgi:hypothetical protein